jgi:hypothetical protein
MTLLVIVSYLTAESERATKSNTVLGDENGVDKTTWGRYCCRCVDDGRKVVPTRHHVNITKTETPHCNLEHDHSCEKPRLRFADGGRVLKLSFARSDAADWNSELFGERGGKRGKCKGFSFGSRRRLLNRLNEVSCAAWLPYFVGMTLPDEAFDDDVAKFAEKAKAWMDAFLKRLQRVSPSACGFWRIEWKARKSGKHEGKLFPHFHLLIWGLFERLLSGGDEFINQWGEVVESPPVYEAYVDMPDSQLTLELVKTYSGSAKKVEGEGWCEMHSAIGVYTFSGSNKFIRRCDELVLKLCVEKTEPGHPLAEGARKMCFCDWASLAWYHIVDSHNVDHLKAGVRVESIRTWGGVRSYAAKYLSKEDCNFLSDVQFGRSWGIFNRKLMPWAKIVELDLDNEVGVRLRRVARHFLERSFGRRVRSPYGITLYCDIDNFRRLWEHAPPDPF